MSVPITISSASQSFSGGVSSSAGSGQDEAVIFGGTWAAGDEYTLSLINNSITAQIGAGYVTALSPTFAMTLGNKIYLLAADSVYFCALGDAFNWNQPEVSGAQSPGNSFIEMSNNFGIVENLTAVTVYQGKLCVCSPDTVQIWVIDPDPALNAQTQVLVNIGTRASLTVQPFGDLDVYMLSDSGIRSVRVRDASNNAITQDVGSPIDLLVQPLLPPLIASGNIGKACSVVEPLTNRYWCYLPGDKIYVYSNFSSGSMLSPNSSPPVMAWSQYDPTYQTAINPSVVSSGIPTTYPAGKTASYAVNAGSVYAWIPGANETSLTVDGTVYTKAVRFTAQATGSAVAAGSAAGAAVTGSLSKTVPFTPEKFITQNGRVFVRAGDNIFEYGGSDNATFDACGLFARTPYLDCDGPATQKDFQGVDAAIEGDWSIAIGTDFKTDDFHRQIYRNNVSSFQEARILFNRRATHFALDFTEYSAGYARLSSALVHFKPNQSKV